MPLIGREAVFEKFKRLGSNSSHFVWMLADLRFYESSEGFVFAFFERKGVILLALEPLIPNHVDSFEKAWTEFKQAVDGQVYAFVSIYEPFACALRALGFSTVPIGSEPWVKLSEHLPTGKSGRGVRSAKNHALKAGLFVEEWSATAIESDPGKQAVLREIYKDWNGPRWLQLDGFTLATDAFAHMEVRRYFVVISYAGVEGYLVASPVPQTRSHYLEDIIVRRSAPKGCGELLTLESMAVLDRDGGFEASLGVVAFSKVNQAELESLPPLMRFLFVTLPTQLGAFYNLDGQKMFRKRFKPHRWAQVNFAVQVNPGSGLSLSRAWVRASIALGFAFRPRLRLTLSAVKSMFLEPCLRYPVTLTLSGINALTFWLVNRGGRLPASLSTAYRFSPGAPYREWILRSLCSDFLYSTPFQFYTCFIALVWVTAWAERTQKRSFLLPLIGVSVVLNELLNYLVVGFPLRFFQPELFHRLAVNQEVGGSLFISMLLGLQLCKLRKKQEVFFAGLGLVSVLIGTFTFGGSLSFVTNLNHFIFLSVGFIIGKMKLESERAHSRSVAHGKTPQARTIPGMHEIDDQKVA